VFEVELDVVPQGADITTAKISHFEDTNLPVLLDESVDGRDEVPIIVMSELACDLYFQKFAAVHFVQLCRHSLVLSVKPRAYVALDASSYSTIRIVAVG